MAGVIGAVGNNEFGVTGVAWNVKILPIRIADAEGNPSWINVTQGPSYVNALRDAGVNVRVINASFGFDYTYTAGQQAIQAAQARDVLLVAAAGNEGASNDLSPIYPASYADANIISVAATDDDDSLWAYSNFGATSVDLAAPGVNILTTHWTSDNPDDYFYGTGTSFAAPMVAGIAALAFSMKPDLTYAEARGAILASVDTLTGLSGVVATGGRLNAFSTLNYIKTQYRPLWKQVVIGDRGGVRRADYVNVRVLPGDPNTTQIRTGDGVNWTEYATLSNSTTHEIAIFTLASTDYVTVEAGVLNRIYVNGGDHADSIATNAAADRIYGGSGNDTLDGYSGDGVIYGDGGNDTLFGGSAIDYLRGGAGNDVFHTAGDGYVDSGSGDEGTDDLLDIDPTDAISQD